MVLWGGADLLGLAGCFGEVQIYCRGTVTRSLGGVHLL